MAKSTQGILAQLEQDYQARRQALLAEQAASEQRAVELAKLTQTHQEEKKRAAALAAAKSALDNERLSKLEPLLADLIGDCELAQKAFADHWHEIEALIRMATIFQDRAQALAQQIGALAQRNSTAFESSDEMLDWIGAQLSLLPNSQNLPVAPSSVVPTDVARSLGIKIFNQSLLQRAYQQRVSAGTAQARREAKSAENN